MTIQNRDAFLNNIAANLGRIRRTTGVVRPKWSVTPQQDVFKDHTPDELVQELKNICKEIHTDVKQTTNKDLAKTLKTTIDEYKGKTIIASSDTRNETFGLDDFYARLSKDYNVHLWDAKHGIENQKVAERADIGITFSDLTLAESGTVVLWNNETNGRSISLLPRIYIAIIPKSTIVPRMTQATTELHERNIAGEDVASCVSFITGPSNSADIEMKLIVGVHGPVAATYIIVEDG